MIALIYSLFGRSLLLIQSIGLLFGVLSVLLGWLVAKKVWDKQVATKVGWSLALFPSLALFLGKKGSSLLKRPELLINLSP